MSFEMNLEWPEGRAHADRDVAKVRISANRQLVTQLFDPEEDAVRDYFRTSAVKLAFWFADNWWRLRHEPIGNPRLLPVDWRMSHEMNSGAGGSVWPALMIYGVGSRVIISPSVGRQAGFESIRYLADRPISVAADDYEAGVDTLFQSVLGSCPNNVDIRALGTLIRQLARERADGELAGWRRLEACLGFNPDQAPDGVIEALVAMEEQVGAASVEEAAVAVQGVESPNALAEVLDASRASNLIVNFRAVHDLAINGFAPPAGAPWHAGEAAAENLRRALNVPEIVRWRDLGDILETRWEDLKEATATARNLPYAARLDEAGDRGRLGLRFRPLTDRRFEIGCFIGDEIWSRGEGLGIVTKAKTDRQKFQRAFAQSLFCPIAELSTVVDLARPTEEQMNRAARRFDVRPSVVKTILVNRGYLQRETLEEKLEAA